MERLFKILQTLALCIALLTPWIYFVGYSYDWGYLEAFSIERQMFFKAPPEYFGLAYIVFIELFTKVVAAIPFDDLVIPVILPAIAIIILIANVALYSVHKTRFLPKFYLWFSRLPLRNRGQITKRLRIAMITSYIGSTTPILILAGLFYFLLLFLVPPLMGYSEGQKAAKKIKDDWHQGTCISKNKMFGCIQILENEQVIGVGKPIAISDKYAAIFFDNSVSIYSLRNKAIKSSLRN